MPASAEDRQQTEAIIRFIRLLDNLAFPGLGLKAVALDQPSPIGSPIMFVQSDDIPEKEWCYAGCMQGAAHYIEQGRKDRLHVALLPGDSNFGLGVYPPYTTEDILFEMAAHEVRHRLQLGSRKVQPITPEAAMRHSRFEFLARIHAKAYDIAKNGPPAALEFDATFIGSLACYEARLGSDIPRMLQVLTATSETLPLIA